MASNLAAATQDDEVRATGSTNGACVYWHRQLPPLEAEIAGEHVIEAASRRVSGSLAHRDELWDICYSDLMENADARLKQEIDRLGGQYAHVLDESVDSRHDATTNEAWLRGRFTYVLYRRPCKPASVDAPNGR
jgi:hypothetical protein